MSANATPTVPNSTELQDLLTRVLEANEAARTASSERNHALIFHGRDSDPYRTAHRTALAASVTAGAAEDDMRKAIRHAGTALDHVHVCNKPTSADLVREVARLHREVERLIEQVETLGGNADVLVRPEKWLPGDQYRSEHGLIWTRHDGPRWTNASYGSMSDLSVDWALDHVPGVRIVHLVPRPADVVQAV